MRNIVQAAWKLEPRALVDFRLGAAVSTPPKW
jgi:hypothetical protein